LGLQKMLKETKSEIQKFIKQIFENPDQEIISSYVKGAESLKLVKKDINQMRTEILLNV